MLAFVVCLVAAPVVVIGTSGRASTLLVLEEGKASLGAGPSEVVLADVMAPAMLQRRANEAAQLVLDLTLGEQVIVTKGRVRVGKLWVHEELLKAGLAWVVPEARKEAALVKLEDEARAAKRGVWADPDPVEPWLWRELTIMGDVHKQLHSGWECPVIQASQCKGGCTRFYSLDDARASGFTLHDACFPPDVLRIAAGSGSPPGPTSLPAAARRACTKDSDCALAPAVPCTCPGCGSVWHQAVRADVAARMRSSFSRAACSGVGCPACATIWQGTRAVCRASQCRAE